MKKKFDDSRLVTDMVNKAQENYLAERSTPAKEQKEGWTEGDWDAIIDHSREAGTYPRTLIVSNGKQIAKCYNRKEESNITQVEAEANAALIAQAKNLYHVVKKLIAFGESALSHMETFDTHANKNPELRQGLNHTLDEATAILQKANPSTNK